MTHPSPRYTVLYNRNICFQGRRIAIAENTEIARAIVEVLNAVERASAPLSASRYSLSGAIKTLTETETEKRKP